MMDYLQPDSLVWGYARTIAYEKWVALRCYKAMPNYWLQGANG
jgi:hypothetical protein